MSCGYWDMTDMIDDEESFDAQEVVDKLFIGSISSAHSVASLKNHSISHVLSVSTNPPVYSEPNSFKCLSIAIEDEEKKDISSYFEQCHKFIDDGRKLGGVLIHCSAGVSRSATIVISYLMHILFKPFLYCFQYLKLIRPCVQPNQGFISQLISYENVLLKNSNTLVNQIQKQYQIQSQQSTSSCSGSTTNQLLLPPPQNNPDNNNYNNTNTNINNAVIYVDEAQQHQQEQEQQL